MDMRDPSGKFCFDDPYLIRILFFFEWQKLWTFGLRHGKNRCAIPFSLCPSLIRPFKVLVCFGLIGIRWWHFRTIEQPYFHSSVCQRERAHRGSGRTPYIKTRAWKGSHVTTTTPLYVKQMWLWHTRMQWPPNTLMIIIQFELILNTLLARRMFGVMYGS